MMTDGKYMRICYGNDSHLYHLQDSETEISEVPEAELTNGIQTMAITTYGDSRKSAFVQIVAINDDIALETWKRIWTIITPEVISSWYGE